ncbi:unnamed protein product, partial [Rotaria sordida]
GIIIKTVGEIAGRGMDCKCGSAECRRRVLIFD